jgi:cellulose synthase/poly-beta-1,6-N-acetylglucosamine synthase-like glycosyltransferase
VFFLDCFVLLFLSISISNFFLIRKPRNQEQQLLPSVGVLVPMRNEAENVDELVASLKAQRGLSRAHFYLLNDNSTDQTFQLLQSSIGTDPRFTVINGAELGAGWLGKPFALQQLFSASEEEILITLDADVRLTQDAISSSVSLMLKSNLDFLSPYPKQFAASLSERLIQPLLQWSWFFTLPLRIAEGAPRTSMAVANGQFFILKRSALIKINGFNAIKSEVIDDIALARELIGNKFRGGVADGSEVAHCRMYRNWRELRAGYGKSLWKAFPTPLTSIAVGIFLIATCIAPLCFGLMGNVWGWLGYFLVVLSRVITALRTGGRAIDSLLHPISIALLIYLALYSWTKRGQVQWKGRTV